MVVLSTLPKGLEDTLEGLECPVFEAEPWVTGKPLNQRRIAMVSSAGIHPRADAPFRGGDSDYRAIPDSVDANDVVMSHVSVNFDRTAFHQDLNAVLPLDRMAELAEDGVIGSVAATHYSFMGATNPLEMEEGARELAGILKADNVDSVVLLPV